MHTGYDNFWMYENRRPEPLLSLPVSDVFSDAVLTDSYKKVQNGRLPSLMSNYKPPQNSAVSSCQNDHRRMTGSQSLWPSPAYSYPSRPSYANNFYFQGFSTQSNHVRHSSEKNHVSKNFAQMCNKNNSHSNYIHTQNYKTNNVQTSRIRVKDVFSLNDSSIQNSVSENNLYHEKKGSQFGLNQRVNHGRAWDSNTQAEYVDYGKVSLPASSQHIPTYQPRAKEQTNSSNQHQYLQNLEEFCDRNFQLSSNNQFHFSNNGEVPKDSSVDTARNNTLSAIGELLSAKNAQGESQKPIQKPVCDTLQRSKRVKINPKRNFNELNSLCKSRPFINTEINNDAFHPGSLQQSERLIQDKSNVNVVTDIHQNHESFSSINQSGESLNQSSACSELRKWRKSGQNPSCNSPSFNHVNSQENSTIKITIPHTGQSTFISFNDGDSINKNHTFSLPCLLDFNDNIDRNEIGTSNAKSPARNLQNTQENEKITFSAFLADQGSLINHNTSHHANPICNISPSTTQSNCDFNVAEQRDRSFRTSIISPPRNLLPSEQSLHQKESVVGCENVENQNGFLLNQNTLSDNSHENSNPVIPNSISTEAVPLNETNINILTIKQELLHPRLEIPDVQHDVQHNQNILEDEVFHQNIKTEKSPEENIEIDEQKAKLQPIENSNPSQEVLPTDADNTENIDFTQANLEEGAFPVKKLEPKSKTMSSALKDVENRIPKSDLLTEISVKEKNSPVKGNEGEIGKKNCESEKNYKSQINRDKLDLLIQFLRKDEEINAAKAKNRSVKKSSSNKRSKESNENHNRRKLSKTCIVKNKNNSREMVSLVSHKTPRVEMNKSTSNSPAIAEENTNSNQTDESETTSIEDINGDRNAEGFEKQVKPNEPFDGVAHAEKEDSFTSGPQNVIESEQIEEVSEKINSQEEKNLMSTMQALQKLKTHFCMSCDLVSSIDSFWINVVSGELRCLNCFKKITLKVEENISVAESNGLICDSEANSSEAGGIVGENCSRGEDHSEDVLKFDCAREKTNDLSENVQYKPIETQNLSVKHKIISKTDSEQACKFNYKNDAIQKKKNLEEPRTPKVVELFEKSIKKNVVLKAKVSDDGIKLSMTEPCDCLKRKSSTKDTEISDEMRKSEENTSPVKSRKKSISSENYSAIKALALSHSEPFSNDLVMKNATKDGNASPEGNHSSKDNRKTDISEDEKGGATDKSDRSHRKIIHKEKDVCETLIKKETNRGTDSQNSAVKRRNSKDSGSHKVRALEENTKTETKQEMSSVKKLDLIENFDKNHTAEEISKKNTKHDSLNKSKMQHKVSEDSIKVNATELCDNLKRKGFTKDTETADKMRKSEENTSPVKSRKKSISTENCSAIKSPTLSHSERFGSKDGCADQKQKIAEHKKQKEKHSEEESPRNSASSQNVSETNKKIESVEHSRKRKNSSECHGIHKVRIVEEHTKKAIKQATHVADKSKTNFPKEDKNKIAQEKSNSMEKLRKNKLSKECEDCNEKSKKETKQDFDSHSDKTKTKGDVKTDKTCEKPKTFHYSKHKMNDSMDTYRRKSQEENASPKHGILKKHSTKAVESPSHMKKNNIFKKEVDFYKIPEHSRKEMKHSCSLHEKKDKRKSEDRKLIGKIPKITHPGSEGNEVFRSPLSDGQLRQSNETSNYSKEVIVKMKSTSWKDKLISTESGARTQKKIEGSEEGDKNARKVYCQNHNQNQKYCAKTGFDKKQNVPEGRYDNNKQNDNSIGQRINHSCKKDTVLKECRQITTENRKVQSNELLAKLIKKTKKLSWSLLGETKKI